MMSNFLFGKIIVNDTTKLIGSKIDFSMVEYGIQNNFALQFFDTLSNKTTVGGVIFRISDNFLVKYCEYFLEPIIYTFDGKPLAENLYNDLNKLQGLIYKIFEFDFVERIELRFSYVEVDENDYELCETSVEEMKNLILNKFLSDTGFPVINVVIKNIKYI